MPLTQLAAFDRLAITVLDTDVKTSEVLKWLFPDQKRRRREQAGDKRST
jgi:hypothetical protein